MIDWDWLVLGVIDAALYCGNYRLVSAELHAAYWRQRADFAVKQRIEARKGK